MFGIRSHPKSPMTEVTAMSNLPATADDYPDRNRISSEITLCIEWLAASDVPYDDAVDEIERHVQYILSILRRPGTSSAVERWINRTI